MKTNGSNPKAILSAARGASNLSLYLSCVPDDPNALVALGEVARIAGTEAARGSHRELEELAIAVLRFAQVGLTSAGAVAELRDAVTRMVRLAERVAA